MAQYALPTANEETTNWTEGAGDADADWYDELDEGFGAGRGSGSGPDDASTSWQSPSNPTNEAIKCKLSAVTDPVVHTGHIVRTRNKKSNIIGQAINVTVELRKASDNTLIRSETWTNIGAAWATRGFTLSEAEAATITDYSDLEIGVIANSGAGANRELNESAFELEVPDAPSLPLQFINQDG